MPNAQDDRTIDDHCAAGSETYFSDTESCMCIEQCKCPKYIQVIENLEVDYVVNSKIVNRDINRVVSEWLNVVRFSVQALSPFSPRPRFLSECY
jgi:hypothetical protein